MIPPKGCNRRINYNGTWAVVPEHPMFRRFEDHPDFLRGRTGWYIRIGKIFIPENRIEFVIAALCAAEGLWRDAFNQMARTSKPGDSKDYPFGALVPQIVSKAASEDEQRKRFDRETWETIADEMVNGGLKNV